MLSLAVGAVLAGALGAALFAGAGSGGSGTQGNVSGAGGLGGSGGSVSAVHPREAPQFSLPRLGGGPAVALPALGSARRHAVVLAFFASWCIPCHEDLPRVAKVADQTRAEGLPVSFVGVDVNDSPGAGLAFARRSGVAFPVGSDPKDRVAAGLFDLPGLPATVFIGPRGRIRGWVYGPASVALLRQWVARIAPAGGLTPSGT